MVNKKIFLVGAGATAVIAGATLMLSPAPEPYTPDPDRGVIAMSQRPAVPMKYAPLGLLAAPSTPVPKPPTKRKTVGHRKSPVVDKMCRVTGRQTGPFPERVDEVLIRYNGIVYEAPVADWQAEVTELVWPAIPCSANRTNVEVGWRRVTTLEWMVYDRVEGSETTTMVTQPAGTHTGGQP